MAVVGRVPPREVVRIFVSIVIRLTIATIVGLIVAKSLVLSGIENRETAITAGYVVVGFLCFLSFFIYPLEGPRVEYTGEEEPKESLIDFLYEDEDKPQQE